jgi:hypothetical protein
MAQRATEAETTEPRIAAAEAVAGSAVAPVARVAVIVSAVRHVIGLQLAAKGIRSRPRLVRHRGM